MNLIALSMERIKLWSKMSFHVHFNTQKEVLISTVKVKIWHTSIIYEVIWNPNLK